MFVVVGNFFLQIKLGTTMDNEDEFSKYTPQHPLPKEVLFINFDLTVHNNVYLIKK